ncbi:MAG: type II secretion system minor pseudopilin GspK [Nitrospirota bacterium]
MLFNLAAYIKGFRNQNGMALVITLLVLIIITALVVEFSYGVYTSTNSLYNWRDSQRLSIMAHSGLNVSARLLLEWLKSESYTPGSKELSVENPFEDFEGTITVTMEDEASKFNVNSIVYSNGEENTDALNSFKKLLDVLSLDERIADRIKDWIDPDSVAELPESEADAKNSGLVSVDELLLINGIKREDYDKLLPYITVYGNRDLPLINVNGAEVPVLMSILDTGKGEFPITEDIAERIVKYREGMPFQSLEEFNSFAGTSLSSNQITVKGENFCIKSIATSAGVIRIIEAVLYIPESSSKTIKYWKEY